LFAALVRTLGYDGESKFFCALFAGSRFEIRNWFNGAADSRYAFSGSYVVFNIESRITFRSGLFCTWGARGGALKFGVRQLAAAFVSQQHIAAKAQTSLRTTKASPIFGTVTG
jgi:hypothetical protein